MTELKVKVQKGILKRAAALAMSVCLGLTMLPTAALAADDQTVQGVVAATENTEGETGNPTKNPTKNPTENPGDSDIPVEKVTLSPETLTFDKIGDKKKLTATVTPADATDKTVTWISNKESVATVAEDGMVTAVGNGEAVITAKAGEKTATATVTVNDSNFVAVEGISVEPKELTFNKIGDKKDLTATVTPSNATNKTVTWSIDKESVATVDAKGTVTSVGVGKATITATAGEKSTTVSVIVELSGNNPTGNPSGNPVAVEKVTVSPEKLTFDTIGSVKKLTATVAPADATDKTVAWKSSDEKIATVDQNGNVKAVAVGKTTITATAGGKSATAAVEVNVANQNGDPDKDVRVDKVTLNKTTLSFNTIGATETLTATVTPANAKNKTVTWKSSNEKVATVAGGKVTAVGNGTAVITATADGKSATANVTVSQKTTKIAITLNGQAVKGKTLKSSFSKKYTLKAVVSPTNADAKNAKVKWSTSNKKIATVNSRGKVTIKKAKGTVTITAKTADGQKASVKFKVSKAKVKVSKIKVVGSKTMKTSGKKKKQTLKVAITPATADNQKVTWKSSNTKIATVNSKGKVTAKKKGKVTITATAKDGSKKKAKFKITVK